MGLNNFKGPESTSNSVKSSNLSDRSNSDDVIPSPKCEVKTMREGRRRRKLREEKKIGEQE